MTTLSTSETDPPDDTPGITCFSVVRIPGGRIGSVIGFYRPNAETALVGFAADDCIEFPVSDVEPCRRLAARARCWIGWD